MIEGNIFAVSTSVGSGKTRAAIEYLASPEVCTQNFIYVAPTIRLIEQTADNLKKRLEQTQGAAARNLHLIHSECRQNDEVPTSVETLGVINSAVGNVGSVIIVTTKTFLTILSKIENRHQWRVILDEAFAPVAFLNFYLGNKVAEGWDYFREVFTIAPQDDCRIAPASGKAAWVEDIASGNIKRSGQKYKGLQPFAAAVSNPALRCELVQTAKTRALLEEGGVRVSGRPQVADDDSESVLLIASFVTPEFFFGFGEVIFMSALFEHTMLYHLWSRVFAVRFRDHPRFPRHLLRDIHRDQGKHVAVGHLLHKDDNSSKYNLSRNLFTGAIGEKEPGQRVIDQLVNNASLFFKGSPYLLQVNNGYGYDTGSPLTPLHAIRIPASSHGLNDYQDHSNVAALAVTNPLPQEAEWIMARTGLSKDETCLAFRIHTTYQAVGRSSVRKSAPSDDRKVFLTAGYSEALMLHQLFKGSTWLGQVGDLKSLREVARTGKDGGLIIEAANSIIRYLDALPSEIRKQSSRSVKAIVAPDCRGRTWSKAVAIACRNSQEWTMESQSFVRRDFEYYFGDAQLEAA